MWKLPDPGDWAEGTYWPTGDEANATHVLSGGEWVEIRRVSLDTQAILDCLDRIEQKLQQLIDRN